MNLEIFHNLINKTGKSRIVEGFLDEFEEYLENKKETNLTAEYRDKISIAEEKILENYASRTSDLGTMLKVYNKTGDIYLATICEESRSHEIIKIHEKDIPDFTKIDSILREKNGRYELDEEATEKISFEVKEKREELIKEQEEVMNSRRQDGHIYEFVEYSGNSIFLIDNTLESNMAFEELKYDRNVFDGAHEGDLFQYIDGKYIKYK